jgi:hypothetical protein
LVLYGFWEVSGISLRKACSSDIINVVLSGNSYLNSIGDEGGVKILEIGKKIYNTLSVKRNEYTGRMIETNRLDGQSNKVMERNQSYDPDYVKENPVLLSLIFLLF